MHYIIKCEFFYVVFQWYWHPIEYCLGDSVVSHLILSALFAPYEEDCTVYQTTSSQVYYGGIVDDLVEMHYSVVLRVYRIYLHPCEAKAVSHLRQHNKSNSQIRGLFVFLLALLQSWQVLVSETHEGSRTRINNSFSNGSVIPITNLTISVTALFTIAIKESLRFYWLFASSWISVKSVFLIEVIFVIIYQRNHSHCRNYK